MKKIFLSSSFFIAAFFGYTQEVDLFKSDSSNSKEPATPLIATFKSTRIVHGHSVELQAPGVLDFRVHHRFGELSQGLYDFFGLDNASTLIAFDYGLAKNINIGVSRSTYLKQMEAFAKWRFLQQNSTNTKPITATLLAGLTNRTLDLFAANGTKLTSNDKTQYYAQLMLARKFNENFSLQISPTVVHYNLVKNATDANTLFSVGFGARHKLSKRVSLNAEYYLQTNKLAAPTTNQSYINSLTIGVDIETGGHVFQLHLTNARGMTAPTYIHENTFAWDKGQIHFGFNISRVFVVRKPKEFK
jgi:hypothetical protein